MGINYVSAGDGSNNVRLHASTWLIRSLAHDSALLDGPHTLTTARMLDAMCTFSGTMRGRPFELLCADALCFRHMMLQQQKVPAGPDASPASTTASGPAAASSPPTLGELLPHCASSKLGASNLQQVRVVAVPAVSASATALSATDRAAFEARWRASPQQPSSAPHVIHGDDLPWLLTRCLTTGALAVPVTAQSGSQDFFLRLVGGLVGFALKAVAAANGTQWKDVQAELDKAPKLPDGESYVLVLWSLNLAPELRQALRNERRVVLGPGQWVVGADKRLALLQATDGRSAAKGKAATKAKVAAKAKAGVNSDPATGGNAAVKLTVPDGMELILTNPHCERGGGLAELLGHDLVRLLQDAPPALADVGTLAAWMAKEV